MPIIKYWLIITDQLQLKVKELEKFSFSEFNSKQISFKLQAHLKILDAIDATREMCKIKG